MSTPAQHTSFLSDSPKNIFELYEDLNNCKTHTQSLKTIKKVMCKITTIDREKLNTLQVYMRVNDRYL